MSSDTSDNSKETVTFISVPEDEQNYEVLEDCTVTEFEYTHGLLEDEDSNIGSMVSIQSEEVVELDGSDMVVPQTLEEWEIETKEPETPERTQPSEENNNPDSWPTLETKNPESWPTLEILPGGVINHGEKNETCIEGTDGDGEEFGENEMVYACAKCPRRFKLLFCLVKHVKWHEDQAKKAGVFPDLAKLSPLERQFIEIQRERQVLQNEHKRRKIEVYTRIAESFANLDNLEDLLK